MLSRLDVELNMAVRTRRYLDLAAVHTSSPSRKIKRSKRDDRFSIRSDGVTLIDACLVNWTNVRVSAFDDGRILPDFGAQLTMPPNGTILSRVSARETGDKIVGGDWRSQDRKRADS